MLVEIFRPLGSISYINTFNEFLSSVVNPLKHLQSFQLPHVPFLNDIEPDPSKEYLLIARSKQRFLFSCHRKDL